MTAKKMLTSAMVALFAFSLMACSNTDQENTGTKEEIKVEEKAEDKDATDFKEESKDANKEEKLSLIHISEPTRQCCTSRMPSSA